MIIKNPGGAIGSGGEIADGSITSAKLATSAVVTAAISAGAVTTAKLSTGAVTSAKLSTSAVVAAAISAGAVTTAKLSVPRVLAAGRVSVGAVSSGYGKDTTVTFTGQNTTNYAVLLTHASQINGYESVGLVCKTRTTSSFTFNCWNSSNVSTSPIVSWAVIQYS